jgi:D-alanyl-D-alanine carboxypeptidase/D-alanyl-D-alanine-endopeptidase (penicillin-binding protein 4)
MGPLWYLSQLRRCKAETNRRARAAVVLRSHLVALACVLLPAETLADVREKVAALAPSGLVLVMDEKGNDLVIQNADRPSCLPRSPRS